MATITSREELKEYCLRKLGFPVIEINVDNDQVEDRISDAFQFYTDYHYDAVERTFYAHEITQNDIDNGYIPIPDSLISVIKVFPYGGANGNMYPMGDSKLAWDFQITNPFSGALGGRSVDGLVSGDDQAGGFGKNRFDMLGYYLNMMNYELIQDMFSGEVPIRFNRHTNRLYLDTDMADTLQVDNYIIAEGFAALDPDTYTDVYNDRWLKRYCTAQIKQQWGANLIKYSGIQLPGGVTLDGDKLFQDAQQEIEKLEEEMQLNYEEPVSFFMG